MADSTSKLDDTQGLVTAQDSFTTSPDEQSFNHLHPSQHDPASDNDASERPVREKLKKTSIQSMPRQDRGPQPQDPTTEGELAANSETLPELESATARTPSPASESRGRLSRKRSYDDSVENPTIVKDALTYQENVEQDAKHTRKRSRDVRAAQPRETKFTTTPIEQALPEAEGIDDGNIIGSNDQADRDMRNSVRSPGKKRSGEDLDNESHREQKIAATDEVKAYRRSEDSERREDFSRSENQAPSIDDRILEGEQNEGNGASTAEKSETPKALVDPPQGQALDAAPIETLESPGMKSQESAKAPTTFASSGFAAMSNSTASPFGTFGTSSSSVFRKSPAPTSNVASSTSTAPNGFDFGPSNPPGASQKQPLSFSSSSATASASPFVANGAAPKLSSFGASAFGSGFANPNAGPGRLKSFAAPTGDLASSKVPETTRGLGGKQDLPGEEDADGGSDDGAALEEVGVGDHEVDSRFQQQEVETGESGERSIFVCPRAQLYFFDKSAWHEKGKGTFKLNINDDDTSSERKARFIMRAHQTFRVLLNQPIFKQMAVGDSKGREPAGKNISFAVVDDGKPTPHLLKSDMLIRLFRQLSDEAEAKTLFHEVSKLQQDLETQV
ncbi:MAG: hypothetical protein Q9174_003825 [Haloplaca sp. 1 TL-2023]